MSTREMTVTGLLANIFAAVALFLGNAFLIDLAWGWFGGTPFALCAILAVVQAVFGQTLALILTMVGILGWAFSRFQNGGYLALAIGGVVLSSFSGVFLHYLGAACALPAP
ncbi:hypothetical protein E3C22_24285 [Jiella endophytica]|uniref:Uncharacterized protein n=1 Tax=Jiella endophytica TaxID=2558362 RepID=A0A4Y8R7Z4_9HYPH|nr:hypothetical protein [Jiella endophytica]TFF17199.1 hypothetical protein E3C22_24285 [Jiella endophytica]